MPRSQRQAVAQAILKPCLSNALSSNEIHGRLMAGSSLLSDVREVDHADLLHCLRDLDGLEAVQSNAVLHFQLSQIHRKAGLQVSHTDFGTKSTLQPGADLQARTLSAARETNQPAASVAGLSSMDLKQLLAEWSDMSETEKTNALASIGGQVSAVSPQAWHQTHKLTMLLQTTCLEMRRSVLSLIETAVAEEQVSPAGATTERLESDADTVNRAKNAGRLARSVCAAALPRPCVS